MPPKKRAKIYQRTFIGCWTCRRRKIKCDAQRPHCQRCTKSKLTCEGYDVKLNWSNPLILKNNEMINYEIDDNDESSTFQRSNIKLCKWNYYKYYQDIDDDLEELNEIIGKKGPFTLFRYKDNEEEEDVDRIDQHHTINTNQKNNNNITTTSNSIPIHKKLIKFIKISIFFKNLSSITIPNLSLPSYQPTHSNYDIIKDTDDLLSIPKEIISHFQKIRNVMGKIFMTQDEDIINIISDLIKHSLSEFIITQSPINQLLILNYILISKLLTKDNNLDELKNIYNKSQSIFQKIQPQQSNTWYLNLILIIMINSTLGIYNPSIFKHHPTSNINTIITNHYNHLKSINHLLNHAQFSIDPQFSQIYEDITQDYNLLKHPSSFKHHHSNNGYGFIQIHSQETPHDEIIKIPKIIDEDDDDDLPPPTIVINFQQEEETPDSEDQELQDDNSKPLFQFEDYETPGKVFGVSKGLVLVFQELVKLINHKKFFSKLGRGISRNFPRVLADFEDLLIKSNTMVKGVLDQGFYQVLIILFYKLILNYPKVLLLENFKILEKYQKQMGIFWFIKNLFDKDLNFEKNVLEVEEDEDEIWGNNWECKQLILEMNDDDWDEFLEKRGIQGVFIL
ncbi:putative transcriptional regulatory protein [Wickerhamomyces ciferrii]|uniref:Transcriptional regulatory protein n=1 Tax=Wickerhamomyces ciferrii (strain ATCC 14091 / BCRC 22168 / CBS 111 / JCM 3599 / NBRC 0793 / NRRL Y-1031 F-60-10) TaxID=1206466 RepID=K0KHP9_WICCF|nr:putative transcriptional regulatory protein [Wickerhamomyces ciferrii]CCH41697.1 putative transcriptional regulatory protein [Wickerhamomyces ciferrii]